MDVKSLTIGGAVTTVIATIILRFNGLVSDRFLLSGAFVLACTLLCWVFGAGSTEFYKRIFVPKPWAAREGMTDAELACVERAKNHFYVAGVVTGGLPLTAILFANFYPPSLVSGLLMTMYGLGIGGLLLPHIYTLTVNHLLPGAVGLVDKALAGRRKVVLKKDGTLEERPADQPSDADEHTKLYIGGGEAPTEPNDKKVK